MAHKRPTATGAVSWETYGIQFPVPLSRLRGGGLPLQLAVELWETYEHDDAGNRDTTCSDYGSSVTKNAERSSSRTQQELLGTATVGPDTLVLSPPGRLNLPLVPPSDLTRPVTDRTFVSTKSVGLGPRCSATGGNTKEGPGEAGDNESRPPHIVLRITPQVGVYWGHCAMKAAGAAKRAPLLPRHTPPSDFNGNTTRDSTSMISAAEPRAHGDQASVIHMTNAEGSARTWRAAVTPGNSIPRNAYDEVVELIYGSIPACCPQAPTFVVAPFSDIGVQLGSVWVGPPVAVRHAIVAHRPAKLGCIARDDGAKAGDRSRGENGCLDGSSVDGDKRYEVAAGDVEPPPEDELFIRTVAAEAEGLLRELRAKDMRVEQRRLALARVREICDKWNSTRLSDGGIEEEKENAEVDETNEGEARDKGDSNSDEDDDDDNHSTRRAHGELYRRFLRALEMALPGVSVYLGILEGGAQTMRYVACTRSSSMVGNTLKRGEGISFSCVGPRYLPSIIYPLHRESVRDASFSKDRHLHHQGPHAEEGWLPADIIAHPDTSSLMYQGLDTDVALEVACPEVHSPKAEVAGDSAVAARYREDSLVVESSQVEGVRVAKNTHMGKLNRNQVIDLQQRQQQQHQHQQQQKHPDETPNVQTFDTDAHPLTLEPVQNMSGSTKSTPSTKPKVFDYEGRVGWPFVCVPLEGSLGASSIGVVGMDTFEQMGGDRRGSEQPEAGVVQAVAEAARFGYAWAG